MLIKLALFSTVIVIITAIILFVKSQEAYGKKPLWDNLLMGGLILILAACSGKLILKFTHEGINIKNQILANIVKSPTSQLYESNQIQITTSLTESPQNFLAVFNDAKKLSKNGDYKKAKEKFEQALQIDPKNEKASTAYQYLGWIEDKLGNSTKSISNFEKSTALNPGSDYSYVYLGYLYYKDGNYEKSRFYCHKAYDINPSPKNKELLKKVEQKFRTPNP